MRQAHERDTMNDILMTVYENGKLIVVTPEDEANVENMTPWFWSESYQKYVTVPGHTVADVYVEWIAQ